MLILHPRIYLDFAGKTSDALLVRDGRILATGEDAQALAGAHDPIVRPDAACLFPALGDAHIHLWGLGLRAGAVDLRGLDVAQIQEALRKAKPQKEGWIYGINWDEHCFSNGQNLSRRLLDDLFADHPICLYRVDRHALWVNSEALRRARFEERFLADDTGHAERDKHGDLTGRLVDGAMEPILDSIPAPDLAEDRVVFLESAQKLRKQGIAFCTIARSPVDRLGMIEEFAAQGTLPLYVDVLVDGVDGDLERVLQAGPRCDHKLRLAGIKFFADGALGSAGAHLLSPYRGGGCGLNMHPPGFLEIEIPNLMKRGWQVAVHAIGDAAARETLDAYQKVPGTIRRALRPRLEHAQLVAPSDAPRFAELNVIASIQPIHLRSDAPWASRRLHDAQLQHLFPWRSLLPATFAAGSDYPIDDLNPWHGIATALTRQGADGVPFRPDDALTREEILFAYTHGAAFACHREHELGSLHPGYLAQIALLDTDPFLAHPEDIWKTGATLLEDQH